MTYEKRITIACLLAIIIAQGLIRIKESKKESKKESNIKYSKNGSFGGN